VRATIQISILELQYIVIIIWINKIAVAKKKKNKGQTFSVNSVMLIQNLDTIILHYIIHFCIQFWAKTKFLSHLYFVLTFLEILWTAKWGYTRCLWV
jgi:hypothetical protein